MSVKTVSDTTGAYTPVVHPDAAHFMDDHNSANASYLDTIGHIRERLQTLNAALCKPPVGAGSSDDSCTDDVNGSSHEEQPPPPPVRSASADAALYDPKMSRGDKALLSRGQAALANSFAFRASTQAFGQHWETMTRKQRQKHLEDYIQSKYDSHPYRSDIRSFLVDEILCKPRGDKHVTWNGYFVERITELVLPPAPDMPHTQQADSDTDTDTHAHSSASTSASEVQTPASRQPRSSKPVAIRFAKPTFPLKGGFGASAAHTALQDAPLVTHVGAAAVSEGAGADGPGVSAHTRIPRATGRKKAAVAPKKATLAASHSFGGMRNRLRRERQAFFVSDNEAFD